MNLKDLASLGVRRAVLSSAAFVGKTPGEGPPGGGDLRGVYLPTKATPWSLFCVLLVLSPDLSPPLTWRLTGLPLRLFIQGESEGDELALRSLGIFDDPVPFASSFQRVASGKSIGELITNPLGG